MRRLTAWHRSGPSLFDPVDLNDVARHSGRSSAVSLASRLVNLVLTLIAQALLGRLVPPAQYGIFAMGMTVLSFLLVFREFGLQTAGIQRSMLSTQEASFLFWCNLAVIGSLGIAGLSLSPAAAWFYQSTLVGDVVATMSVAAMIGGISAQHSMLLRRQYRFGALACIDTISLIAGIVVGSAIAYERRDVWGLVAMYAVQQCAVSLFTFAYVRWRPGFPRHFSEHAGLLYFGIGVTVANVIYYATNNIGAILIGRSLGETSTGYYNRAQQINNIPSTVLFSSVYGVVFTSLSRLFVDEDSYRIFYTIILRRVSVFYMTLSGFLVFSGRDVTRVLLGPGWDATGSLLSIFAVGLLGSGMAQMTGMLYQSQSRIREFQIWGCIDALIRISAILIGAHWGATGIAWGFALSTTFVAAPLSLWFVGRHGPVSIRDQLRAVVPATICFFLSATGAVLGSWLCATTEVGLASLMIKLACSIVFVGIFGFVVPPTRLVFLDVIHSIRRNF